QQAHHPRIPVTFPDCQITVDVSPVFRRVYVHDHSWRPGEPHQQHASPVTRDYRTSWAKPPAIRLKQNTPLSGAIRRFWPTMTESPGSAVTGDDSSPRAEARAGLSPQWPGNETGSCFHI